MKIRKFKVVLLSGVALIMSMHSAARADLLVSNLDQPFNENTPIAELEFWGAQSFFSGVNSNLTSIDAIVGNGAGSPSVVAVLRKADINGDIDNTAGGILATFAAPDMSGATSIRTFLPDNAVSLLLTEKYWFILGSSNAGTYDWSYAEGPLTTGPGSLDNYADSSDGGVTWTHHNETVDPYFIRVNGVANAIPEPSSLLLLGALGLCPLARRRPRLNTMNG